MYIDIYVWYFIWYFIWFFIWGFPAWEPRRCCSYASKRGCPVTGEPKIEIFMIMLIIISFSWLLHSIGNPTNSKNRHGARSPSFEQAKAAPISNIRGSPKGNHMKNHMKNHIENHIKIAHFWYMFDLFLTYFWILLEPLLTWLHFQQTLSK